MATQAIPSATRATPFAQPTVHPVTINVPLDFNLQAVDARLQRIPPEKSVVEAEVHRLNTRPTNKADLDQSVPTLPEPLNFFNGTYKGPGFNMIFRPGSKTPMDTTFPNTPISPDDNVMEINLTMDQIQFTDTLGAIPNRGLESQPDINLAGVSYVQQVLDVTNPVTGKGDAQGKPIHFEPGMWLVTPPTQNPSTISNLARMASIPHGTTIIAQGTCPIGMENTPATIDTVTISPTGSDGTVFTSGTFQNMDVNNANTRRLPQDLTPFINAGTVTQAILSDPNTVLRNANAGKTIIASTRFVVDTATQFGSTTNSLSAPSKGTTSIDMLQPNALPVRVTATFYIQKVQYNLTIPQGTKAGVTLTPSNMPADPTTMPAFVTSGPGVASGRNVHFNVVQIQYSQTVQLSFNGLSWPHISVATLNRAEPIQVPLEGPAQVG